MFKEDLDIIPDNWLIDEEEETALESSLFRAFVRGHTFWCSWDYGGIKVPKTAPQIIHCTTGDAFDHK